LRIEIELESFESERERFLHPRLHSVAV
jgi:hypothetical protein